MKRFTLALASAALSLSLMPGLALATAMPGVPDQVNANPVNEINTPSGTAQTFTVGKTGLLTGVALDAGVGIAAPPVLTVQIQGVDGSGLPDGTVKATGGAGPLAGAADWFYVIFDTYLPVTKGDHLAIVISSTAQYSIKDNTTDTYSGGQAFAWYVSAWGLLQGSSQDLAFETFVDPQTTGVQWDKTSISAGVSTSLTLTETATFPAEAKATVVPAGPAVSPWSVKIDSLPAWFTPSGITCTPALVNPADCVTTNIGTGGTIPVQGSGSVTIAVTGTGDPSAAGTIATQVEGCVAYALATLCVPATVNITVGGTAPPTTALPAPSPEQPAPPLWFLAAGSCVALGGVLLLLRRQSASR